MQTNEMLQETNWKNSRLLPLPALFVLPTHLHALIYSFSCFLIHLLTPNPNIPHNTLNDIIRFLYIIPRHKETMQMSEHIDVTCLHVYSDGVHTSELIKVGRCKLTCVNISHIFETGWDYRCGTINWPVPEFPWPQNKKLEVSLKTQTMIYLGTGRSACHDLLRHQRQTEKAHMIGVFSHIYETCQKQNKTVL